MKNRKTIIVAFVLVACMLVGVGYAAVTNVLDIQGSAEISQLAAEEELKEDLYFEGVVLAEGVVNNTTAAITPPAEYTANINTNNPDKAQFTVNSLRDTGDSVKIVYRIKNDSAFPAEITMKSITNTNGTTADQAQNGIFHFDYYFGSENTRTASLPANSTIDVTVVITYANQTNQEAAASFIVELNAVIDNSTP